MFLLTLRSLRTQRVDELKKCPLSHLNTQASKRSLATAALEQNCPVRPSRDIMCVFSNLIALLTQTNHTYTLLTPKQNLLKVTLQI